MLAHEARIRRFDPHGVPRQKTVEQHRSKILAKLGLTDRVHLTRYAFRRGIIEP